METTKEIICVYQDCILCGDRGKKVKELIFEKKLNIRKVSFASTEGRRLIYEAVFAHKMGSLPFFTDGSRFSYELADLIEPQGKNEEEKPAKKTRKRRSKKAKGDK